MLLTRERRWADAGSLQCYQMKSPTASSHDKSCVYILRLWRADSSDSSWRASLENARTGGRIGFENLEHLFAFLMEQTERDEKIKQEEKENE